MFQAYFPSIPLEPRVVHPGINLLAYEPVGDSGEPDTVSSWSLRACVFSYVHCVPYAVLTVRPTVLSLNRFEKMGTSRSQLTSSHFSSKLSWKQGTTGRGGSCDSSLVRVEENTLAALQWFA